MAENIEKCIIYFLKKIDFEPKTQLFSGTKPETQKTSHSHQTILMVPNPSIRKQENEIHPTKNQNKVTIITKKESRREL